jgi:hypothetical protein
MTLEDTTAFETQEDDKQSGDQTVEAYKEDKTSDSMSSFQI